MVSTVLGVYLAVYPGLAKKFRKEIDDDKQNVLVVMNDDLKALRIRLAEAGVSLY